MSKKVFRTKRIKRGFISFLLVALIANCGTDIGKMVKADSVTTDETEVDVETSEEYAKDLESVYVEESDSKADSNNKADENEADCLDIESEEVECDGEIGDGEVVITKEETENIFSENGSEFSSDDDADDESIDDAEQQEEKTEGTESGDWRYYTKSDGTIYISEYLGNAKDIVIPASIDGKRVYSIDCSFDNNIRTVTISNGIKEIGYHVFERCSKLTRVTIPPSIISIGYAAFNGCQRLTQINIPMGVTSISSYAFQNCTGINSFSLPASITSIGDCAFKGCTGITSLNLPLGVTEIGMSAFEECTNLKSIIIPSSVATIKDYAFEDCSSLSSVTIPRSVEKICFRTFCNCSSLKSIVIHDNVEHIDYGAFSGCSNLSYVEVQYKYTTIADFSAVFQGTNKNMIIFCPQGSEAETHAKKYGYTYLPLSYKYNPFKDVAFGKYYSAPVIWAYHSSPQVTSGTSGTQFSPSASCTRAQVVTFLWNACGKPESKNRSNPFKDVSSSKYYYKAVLWAVEKGVTAGVDSSHFAPNETCTRAQFVSFLWRLCGSPKPQNKKNPFTADVAMSYYYYNAVLWANEKGITSGTDSTHFSPNSKVTRAQGVTFLYNARDIIKNR